MADKITKLSSLYTFLMAYHGKTIGRAYKQFCETFGQGILVIMVDTDTYSLGIPRKKIPLWFICPDNENCAAQWNELIDKYPVAQAHVDKCVLGKEFCYAFIMDIPENNSDIQIKATRIVNASTIKNNARDGFDYEDGEKQPLSRFITESECIYDSETGDIYINTGPYPIK